MSKKWIWKMSNLLDQVKGKWVGGRVWGGGWWVGFFPFISEVSSSHVVYLLHSSPFSVHFWNSYHIAFLYLLVNPTSTVAKQQVLHENLNASNLPWLWFLCGPSSLFLSGVCFFLDCTHRVRWNGVPNHSVLRSIPISFCS